MLVYHAVHKFFGASKVTTKMMKQKHNLQIKEEEQRHNTQIKIEFKLLFQLLTLVCRVRVF